MKLIFLILILFITFSCTEDNECNYDTDCNNNQICNSNKCEKSGCEVGYKGKNCKKCIDGFQDNDNNSSCYPTCEKAGLKCDDGQECSDKSGKVECIASCENIDCSNHGNCEVKNNIATCNCEDNYHSEQLECVKDSLQCADNEHEESNKCVGNTKMVNCTDNTPEHGVKIDSQVEITWSNGNWSVASDCDFSCKDGYNKFGNNCVTDNQNDVSNLKVIDITNHSCRIQWDGNPNAETWLYIASTETTGSRHNATNNEYIYPVLKANITFIVYIQGVGSDLILEKEFTTLNEYITCETNSCTEPHKTICSVEENQIVCSCDNGYHEEGNNCIAEDENYNQTISATISNFASKVKNVTTSTIIELENGEINDNIVLSDNLYPVKIRAKNLLGVKLNKILLIKKGANNITIEGFLMSAKDSKIRSLANNTHITRCRFDGSNEGGMNQWITIGSPEGITNPNEYTGKDAEISYCEFLNYSPNRDNANSTIFLFAYKGQQHIQQHKIHHNLFKHYHNYSNGREPISLYTPTNSGGWDNHGVRDSPIHNIKVYNNLFDDCLTDGEIIKGGIKGTEFYNNTILDSRGAISFRFGSHQKAHHNIIIANNTPFSGGITISTPDCEVYDNIILGVSDNNDALKTRKHASNYEGAFRFKIENNFIEGGKRTLNIGFGLDSYMSEDEGIIRNNTFSQGDGLKVISSNNYPTNKLTSNGNIVYGSNIGDMIEGFEIVESRPDFPDLSSKLKESDVGINAQ